MTAVAETHIHADFLSGARQLVERHRATAYLSRLGGADWQSEWAEGHEGVCTLGDGDKISIGRIEIEAVHTAGHTPEHLSYLVTDYGGGADQPVLFLTGDFIFVGDVGRPDLLESAAGVQGMMEPSARILRESLRATRRIPGHVQILPAHGAGSACGKALGAVPSSVLDYERLFNGPFKAALEKGEEEFVAEILHGQPEPPPYFARMKRHNKMGPKLLEGPPEPRRFAVPDLEEKAAAGGRLWFLDLREDPAGYMQRHVAGSLHCPLKGVNVSMIAGSYIEEDEEIVILTESGEQVETAVRQLIRIGLDRIAGWAPAEEALQWAAGSGRLKTIASVQGHEVPVSGVTILDVRSATEHAEASVPGAVNIAYTRLRPRQDEIPAGGPLYVHCETGKRASAAVSFLESLGREVVWVEGPTVGAATFAA